MNLKNLNLTYRKLCLSDFKEFKKLFFHCYGRKITYAFFKWRYFTNKNSFCYGAFASKILIANIGMVSIQLNNNIKEKIFSRHSSMVLKKYRGLGIFSELSSIVKKKFLKNIKFVIMWPNKNNFSNFGIKKKNIIQKKYYLYKTSFTLKNKHNKKTENLNINKFKQLNAYLDVKDSLFLKNHIYFYKRYLSFKKKEYFINKFTNKNLDSYFILKKNKQGLGYNYVVLDHVGSTKLRSKHLLSLIKEQNNLIFLNYIKINNNNLKLIHHLNLKVGFIKQLNFNQKKIFFKNKKISLGDTDIFMTTGN